MYHSSISFTHIYFLRISKAYTVFKFLTYRNLSLTLLAHCKKVLGFIRILTAFKDDEILVQAKTPTTSSQVFQYFWITSFYKYTTHFILMIIYLIILWSFVYSSYGFILEYIKKHSKYRFLDYLRFRKSRARTETCPGFLVTLAGDI